MAFTTFTNPVYVGGKPDVSAHYGPWASVQAYLNFVSQELLTTPVKGTTIGVLESGTVVEYWNPTSSSTFIRKAEGGSGETPSDATITIKQGGITKGSFTLNQSSNATISLDAGGTPTPIDSPIFVIDLDTYGITEGYMSKGTDGHYTSTQYAQMKANGIGISQAIRDAAEQGHSKVLLPHGTYCFCPRDYSPLNWASYYDLPCIPIFDVNNLDIDLGGSSLCFLVDSNEWCPYKHDHSGDTWMQAGTLIGISYCNNLSIHNGNFVGDRFIRDYASSEAQYPPETYANMYYIESANESTYGILVMGGNLNITIDDCNFEGFMGDGISGAGNSYQTANPVDETVKGDNIRTSFPIISSGSQTHGFRAYPENTYRSEAGVPSQQASCENTCITELYTVDSNGNRQAVIDTDRLYTLNVSSGNRKACKDARIFMVGSTGGYNRTTGCYPNNIGILTYSTIQGNPQPLRYFEVGYQDKFQLSPDERYLRLQYTYEDRCAQVYSGSGSAARAIVLKQNPMFLYRCTRTTTGTFNEVNWTRVEYNPSVSSPTYDSSLTYNAGDTVYYYALATYTPKQSGVSGEWDSSNWDMLPSRNHGSTVDYDPSRTYYVNQTVTQIVTEGYLPFQIYSPDNQKAISTDYVWTPYVDPLVGICEMHTYGVYVNRCQFINCNRGNVSNMPNDTVLRDCTFRKYMYTPNCGYTAPNFCGYLSGSRVAGETTQYHVDLEDYVATSFKMYNCRFESTDLSVGKVLLNTLNQTIDGCQGQMLLCVYTANQTTYVTNNNFDRFSFSLFPGNEKLQTNSFRHYKKLVVLQNNKLILNDLPTLYPWCGNIKFIDNQISIQSQSGSDHWTYDPYGVGDFSFRGNVIDAIKFPGSFSINAKSLFDNTIDATNSSFRLYGPVSCYGTSVSGGRTVFHGGWQDMTVDNLSSNSHENHIEVIVNASNTSKFIFNSCKFDSDASQGTNPFCVVFKNGSHTAHTVDVYFNNVSFVNQPTSSTMSYYMHSQNNGTGDTVNVHFINCTFNLKQTAFCSNSLFNLSECKGCTFITTPTFNGTPLANA